MVAPRWKRVSPERYDEMLEILPPLDFEGRRFLVGEPVSHRDGRATYRAFVALSGEHFECCEPLTRLEFRAVTPSHILENCDASA